jgi:asparagine synthase (glutamine-hydrolysing)
MCGIAGFTHRDRSAAEAVGRRINAALLHRGPDQQGVWASARMALCAVRLKILDLEGGDQPIASDDGGLVIAFNGEIYNHAELRRELEQRGHGFHSRCDTEVVLHAFQEWDTGCFARLRGMFAAALWSEARQRLVLARDRMGIKPLYYHQRGSELYFGSELKAILEHEGAPRMLDPGALDQYLSLNWVPGPRTLVAGIHKLAPGHLLEWRNGEARTEAWWRLEFRPRAWRLEEAREALDGLLRDAVREHLVADVPVGVWSSGGIDSSTILHYAAEAVPSGLKTFSVGFPGRSFDESRYFRETARRYGTEHHEFELNPDSELRDAIEEFASYADEPNADAGALPVWYLARMSRATVTVALAGDGADELFGGYETYLADGLARPLRLVPGGLRRAALAACERYWPVSDDKVSLEYRIKRGLAGSSLPPDEAHLFWNGAFSREQKERLYPYANGGGLQHLADRAGAPAQAGFLNRYLFLDQRYYLPDDILCKVDRMSMAHSLEVRPPFLDHRIVEFAASLPQELKIRRFRLKHLLKELMRDKLPPSVISRKKTGFDIPTHDWFRGVLRDLLLDTVSEDAVRATGLFDAAATQRLIRDHMERRINAGYQLWGLLTLFLWIRRWRIATPPPEQWRQMPAVGALATS